MLIQLKKKCGNRDITNLTDDHIGYTMDEEEDMRNQEIIDNFKKYLERLNQKYNKCNSPAEKRQIGKKIADCEELIRDFKK